MDKIMLIVILIVIVMSFFLGNIMFLDAMFGGDRLDWSEYWILFIIAIVIDLILIYFSMAKIIPPVKASFELMKNGLKNRKIAKKESAKRKKMLESEELNVNRFQELKGIRISESAIIRTLHFCQLIETINGKEQLQDCLAEVKKKQSILEEISDVENKILKAAESCKNADDIEKCRYYLDILKSAKITPEIASLEDKCAERVFERERERRAIWLWAKVFLLTFAALIAFLVALYIKDTPYREMRSMIEDQSLTVEMCDGNNKDSEESYYDDMSSITAGGLLNEWS